MVVDKRLCLAGLEAMRNRAGQPALERAPNAGPRGTRSSALAEPIAATANGRVA